jgi:hypothetical protein
VISFLQASLSLFLDFAGNMSSADLAMSTATPPPGVMANFDNPSLNAYILIIVTTIFMVLLYGAMTISLYTKLQTRKKISLDDCESFPYSFPDHANASQGLD